MAFLKNYDASGRGMFINGGAIWPSDEQATHTSSTPLGGNRYFEHFDVPNSPIFDSMTLLVNYGWSPIRLEAAAAFNNDQRVFEMKDVFLTLNDLYEGATVILAGDDQVIGNKYADGLRGFSGDDTISGNAGDDRLDGGSDDDVIKGGSGRDTVLGASGNDRLYGDADSDWLEGGSGNDRLYGGADFDLLEGGKGEDHLYGGSGPGGDRFVFSTRFDSQMGSERDTIHGFERGHDEIDLHGIDARAHNGSDERFLFSGQTEARFSVWWSASNTGIVVQGDVNGDAEADFEIAVTGVSNIREGDFLL